MATKKTANKAATKATKKADIAAHPSSPEDKRKYLSQADVPSYSLEKALSVAQALADHLGNGPATPLRVAQALKQQPGSSTFRMLSGASVAYGLTSGGYNADQIGLMPLAKRIVRPTSEGDDLLAKREALLKPRVLAEFFGKYKNAPVPRPDIAQNVLEDMGVPREKTGEVFQLIVDSARLVGFIVPINDKEYFEISSNNISAEGTQPPLTSGSPEDASHADFNSETHFEKKPEAPARPVPNVSTQALDLRQSRVFVTHGKNRSFIDPIKELLGFGNLTPIVSVDKESVSKPVPDKVMDDMRSCGAAIIHVEDEQRFMDGDKEVVLLNSNVLIEIGAAMALYGHRFVLLVKEGVTLPSNLQGLYKVFYQGDSLSGEATIKLLKAINDLKQHSLPLGESQS